MELEDDADLDAGLAELLRRGLHVLDVHDRGAAVAGCGSPSATPTSIGAVLEPGPARLGVDVVHGEAEAIDVEAPSPRRGRGRGTRP